MLLYGIQSIILRQVTPPASADCWVAICSVPQAVLGLLCEPVLGTAWARAMGWGWSQGCLSALGGSRAFPQQHSDVRSLPLQAHPHLLQHRRSLGARRSSDPGPPAFLSLSLCGPECPPAACSMMLLAVTGITTSYLPPATSPPHCASNTCGAGRATEAFLKVVCAQHSMPSCSV